MCAHPCWSSVSLMKSSRLRFELGAKHAMPRLQMSQMCIGVVVICVTAHVACDGPSERFTDRAAYRLHWHAGGYVEGMPAAPDPAHQHVSACPHGPDHSHSEEPG